jgi:hypothetical protein
MKVRGADPDREISTPLMAYLVLVAAFTISPSVRVPESKMFNSCTQRIRTSQIGARESRARDMINVVVGPPYSDTK